MKTAEESARNRARNKAKKEKKREKKARQLRDQAQGQQQPEHVDADERQEQGSLKSEKHGDEGEQQPLATG